MVGHNIHASEMIAAEIENWNSSKIILVLGMVSGKDPIKFVKKIAHKISLLILSQLTTTNIFNHTK